MGVISDGTDASYNIPPGLMYSYPVTIGKDKKVTIVPGLACDDFARSKMDATAAELKEENEMAQQAVAWLARL